MSTKVELQENPAAWALAAIPTEEARVAHKGYDVEYRIAKRLGAKRIGGPGNIDIDGGWFCAEVECGLIPGYIRDAVQKVRSHARPGQLQLVIQHEKGDRYDDARVSMSFKDWLEWFGRGGPLAEYSSGLRSRADAERLVMGEEDAEEAVGEDQGTD